MVAAGHEAQLLDVGAALAADRRLAVGMVGHRQHEVDALELEQRRARPAAAARAGGRGRARRPARRASSGRPRSRTSSPRAARGRQHAEVGERAEQVDLLLHARLRVVRADDHRVVLEERVEPAGRRPSAARAGGRPPPASRPARTARSCASACRCRAARRAGSRTGRARPCTRRRSRSAGRGCPGRPSCERHGVRRDAKMSA